MTASPFDQLLYELEGEWAVRGDAATSRLDALLTEARKLSPFGRMKAQALVTKRRHEAAADVEVRQGIHAELLAKAATWDQRAAEAPPEFAEQARERAAQIRSEAASIAEEIVEYEAAVRQFDEIYLLLERAGQP